MDDNESEVATFKNNDPGASVPYKRAINKKSLPEYLF